MHNSADSGRKLTLLYVANDVIQNSKKKGPEYRTEFAKVLPRVCQGISKWVKQTPAIDYRLAHTSYVQMGYFSRGATISGEPTRQWKCLLQKVAHCQMCHEIYKSIDISKELAKLAMNISTHKNNPL